MPVTYLIRFSVIPDQRACFLALLGDVLDAMRTEPMLHEAILHRDPNDEHRLMFYEAWEDYDDVFQVQLQRPYRRAYHEALEEMIAEPREISTWQPLRADRGAGVSSA